MAKEMLLLIVRVVLVCSVLVSFLNEEIICQNTFPKREFRAVFIATVNNLDFPSNSFLSTQAQKEEFISILNRLSNARFNAVFVQVRPAADAFYESSLEPWSEWLTGKQGEAPRPYYDPLAFMVEECHKRGIEIHAWLNPYRAVQSSSSNVCFQHITKRKPEWFFQYEGATYFDPGHPEARKFIVDVIADIVSRYDIDGIHFDDYFYPYPNGKLFTQDYPTFYKYKGNFSYLDDWRRNNVNQLIREVSEIIRSINPRIKFGVSPYGIWREKSVSDEGSETRIGQSCYDHLYADVRLWLQKGWIDYVAPQLYQHTKYERAPFKKMVQWWEKNCFGKHLYISHAMYRYMIEEGEWQNKEEMYEQVRFVRSRKETLGSVFYSYSKLALNKGKFFDFLRDEFYQYPALPPTMPWIDSIPPLPPVQLYITEHPLGNKLSWLSPSEAKDGEKPFRYVVYAIPKQHTPNLENPSYIVGILPATQTEFLHVFRRNYPGEEPFQYYVTSLDRLHNESMPWSEELEAFYKTSEVSDEKFPLNFVVSDEYPYLSIHIQYFYYQTLEMLKEWLHLSEKSY
ncbi:MAG: family 10 glycosylhydrolase [Cytophagales bacterium]|nr:family 10 glycosylhydrolase [Cytophagales bacterium]MDW8383216.1 family 10 glycosylhydrolase [Flammeovirgaceae bacterium]